MVNKMTCKRCKDLCNRVYYDALCLKWERDIERDKRELDLDISTNPDACVLAMHAQIQPVWVVNVFDMDISSAHTIMKLSSFSLLYGHVNRFKILISDGKWFIVNFYVIEEQANHVMVAMWLYVNRQYVYIYIYTYVRSQNYLFMSMSYKNHVINLSMCYYWLLLHVRQWK